VKAPDTVRNVPIDVSYLQRCDNTVHVGAAEEYQLIRLLEQQVVLVYVCSQAGRNTGQREQ